MRWKPTSIDARPKILFTGVAIGLAGVGCTSDPAPAAASNQVLHQPPEFGVGLPGEDDRWASATLDARQFDELRRVLRSMVTGDPPPLEPASYGIRFEDVPNAILTAAPEVEMAVTGQRLNPAVATVRFKDGSGRVGTAKIELRRMGTVASVEFLTGRDRESLRIQQQIERDVRASEGRLGEGAEALAILEAAVRDAGGTVEARDYESERYEINLLMLDNQPAQLVVRREPDPKVLSWKAWAGTFPDGSKAEALGRAFEAALHAWAKIPQPVQPDPFDSR
ncbi:MAG: hypothetical protein CMJ54_11270 [Planctomycetaceae bacterium]|nr:hypothetical protein [Planctomycetaceae bacterium]